MQKQKKKTSRRVPDLNAIPVGALNPIPSMSRGSKPHLSSFVRETRRIKNVDLIIQQLHLPL